VIERKPGVDPGIWFRGSGSEAERHSFFDAQRRAKFCLLSSISRYSFEIVPTEQNSSLTGTLPVIELTI